MDNLSQTLQNATVFATDRYVTANDAIQALLKEANEWSFDLFHNEFLKERKSEVVSQRCSVERVFLEILQNSQEKRDSDTGVFL